MRPGDGRQSRKLCLSLSMALRTGVDYFMRMPLNELTETAKEAAELYGR